MADLITRKMSSMSSLEATRRTDGVTAEMSVDGSSVEVNRWSKMSPGRSSWLLEMVNLWKSSDALKRTENRFSQSIFWLGKRSVGRQNQVDRLEHEPLGLRVDRSVCGGA